MIACLHDIAVPKVLMPTTVCRPKSVSRHTTKVQVIASVIKQQCACRQRLVHEPDLLVTRAGGIQRISADKVHIEYLHISQLLLTLSFTPSPGTQPKGAALLATLTKSPQAHIHTAVHDTLPANLLPCWCQHDMGEPLETSVLVQRA